MNRNRDKILKMVIILALLCAGVWALTNVHQKNSMTLEEYAELHPEIAYRESTETEGSGASEENETETDSGTAEQNREEAGSGDAEQNETETSSGTAELGGADASSDAAAASTLTGAVLNGEAMADQRVTYAASFYYEPLSDSLRRYITGVSFPAESQDSENPPVITYDDLCYLHILHYDFDGNPAEGELICNSAIAQDLVEIFYELYRNEYQLESVLLIDEFDGDDTASMEANNTSCFNYRVVEGSTSLSKHALGLAIDINPLYNPYITYEKDGSENISPAAAMDYADRSASFPYKIDENDLCYKLFIQHGFTWGGNWNSCKDYQHFQKAVD